MRSLLAACLLCVTALAAVPAASPAWARGGDGQGGGGGLLDRGHALLRQAEGYYFRKDFANAARAGKEAERIFHTVLNQEPRNYQAALLGGQAATLAGDLKSAVAWVDRYRRLSPGGDGDPELQYVIAFVQLLGDKRPDRALRSLTRMYNLDPQARPVARDNLWFLALSEHGRALVGAEKYDEAIVQFRLGARIAKRMGSRPKELMMLANVGVSLMQGDRYIEATEVFGALSEGEPKNPLWMYRLGLCTAAQSKFAEAVPIYRQVLVLLDAGYTYPGVEAELKQVHLRLGNCLRHLAEKQVDETLRGQLMAEAEKELRLYIRLAPDDTVGHKWLAVMLLENLDKPYEALEHFEKAFDLDPICEGPLRYLIQIHSNFPPPQGVSAEDWRRPIEAWKKDLEQGADRREKVRDERKVRTGNDGCD